MERKRVFVLIKHKSVYSDRSLITRVSKVQNYKRNVLIKDPTHSISKGVAFYNSFDGQNKEKDKTEQRSLRIEGS